MVTGTVAKAKTPALLKVASPDIVTSVATLEPFPTQIFPLVKVAAALTALLMGWLSLRASGIYFIMVTLAFTQMFFYLFSEAPGLGVELDEKLAAKYPYKRAYLPVNRLEDGTLTNW